METNYAISVYFVPMDLVSLFTYDLECFISTAVFNVPDFKYDLFLATLKLFKFIF